jgi:hypothetical protein
MKYSELVGKHFHPEFKPQLTPAEMLQLGVFGGCYFEKRPSEFPQTWFVGVQLSLDGKQHKELNHYGVLASQPRSAWQAKGWIHKDDPLGWFQWYCRYYLGRRHPDDERQIKRWKAIRRHLAQISYNCRPGDQHCRRKQRQAVLQWAYDPRRL